MGTRNLLKRITNFSLAFVVAVSALMVLAPVSQAGAAPLAGTTVVTGDTTSTENTEGWMFNRDVTTSTPFTFNDEAAVLGSGSLYVKPISGSVASNKFVAENFLLSEMSDIDSISFDYKIGPSGVATDNDQIYINVYANFGESSATKFYDCRYTLVAPNASTSNFSTLSFDTGIVQQVATRTGGQASPYTCPAVPSAMDLLSPGSTIRAFAINVGDTTTGDAGVDAYLDNVVVNSSNGMTTYDLEPLTVSACADTDSLVTTDLTTWDLSETRATGHNEIVDGGLHIWTEGATSTDKAAGYYATDFALQNAGTEDTVDRIDYTATTGIIPGLQMVTDFDNDGTPDGILVGEAVYGNDWWLSNSAAQFVKDGAPSHTGGFGSDNHGTLDQWLNAFPNARVKAIGYSLGSGVLGDGILKRITLGCVDYSFDLAPVVPPVDPTDPTTPTDNDSDTEDEDDTDTVITPIITSPASVLGANSDSDTDQEGSSDVAGTTDDKTAQTDNKADDGTILGLAWYWWLLIIVGLAGIAWWLVALYRRRSTQE